MFAVEEIPAGSFLLVYHGDMIDTKRAEERERKYDKENYGSFMYFFNYKGSQMW